MKLLKKLYMIDSKSGQEQAVTKYVHDVCLSYGATVTTDEKGNLYAVKGQSETYPCLVAHLDEVHDKRPKGFRIIETDGHLFGFSASTHDFHGIGADDKNGIWIALKCLKSEKCIKCAFFVGEEIGCNGSNAADMKFFEDCRWVVECDRRNAGDFITIISGTKLCSDEFVKAADLKKFGYKVTDGLSTDVGALKRRGLNVACCNVSCAYYNPHTKYENTCIKELLNTLAFVQNIIKNCTDVFEHKYEAPAYTPRVYNFYDDDYPGWWGLRHDPFASTNEDLDKEVADEIKRIAEKEPDTPRNPYFFWTKIKTKTMSYYQFCRIFNDIF